MAIPFPLTQTIDDFNRVAGNLAGSQMSSHLDRWADPIEIDSDDSAVEIITQPTPVGDGVEWGRFASISGRGSGRTVNSYDRTEQAGVEVWARIRDSNHSSASVRLWWAISNPNVAEPTGYFLEYDASGANTLKVFRKQGATETEILNISSPPTVDEGDRLGIWHDNSIEGKIRVFFYNFDGTDEFVELGSVEDATLESGFLGLDVSPGNDTLLDDFGGGQRPLTAFQKQVGTFAKIDTGVGDEQTITLPFTPQAVILWCTRREATGFAGHMELSYGFSDGTNHYSINATSDDVQPTTQCNRRQAEKALTIWETFIAADTLEAECDLSIITNGFTLDWTTNCSHEYLIHYMAIGGITNAKVGTFTLGAGGLGNKSFTGVGFSPDLLYFAGISDTVAPPSQVVHAMFELGWCNRGGDEAALAITSQDALFGGSAQTTRMQVTTRCLLGMAVTSDATLEEASFVSMDNDGFTLNLDKQAFDRVWGYLALEGVESEIGVDTSGAATGEKTTSLTSTAIADPALMLYSFNRASSGVAVPDGRVAIGGASEAGQRACMWGGDVDDPLAVSINDMFASDDNVLALIDTDEPTAVDDLADLTELHPDGFTLDWTTVTGAKQFVYVAFGPPRGQVPSAVRCEVGSFTARTGTGLQTITTAFQPKAVILWGTKDTSVPADSVDVSNFIGFASGVGEEWAIWVGSEDGVVSTPEAFKAFRSDTLLLYDLPGDNSNPVARVIANLDAFLTTGFRLNFTLNLDAGMIVNYMVLGGDIEAKVVEKNLAWDIPVDEEVYVSDVGFESDVIIVLNTSRAGLGDEQDVGDWNFGFGLPNLDQMALCASTDINTFDKEYTLHQPNRFICTSPDNKRGGFQGEFSAKLTSVLPNGFAFQVIANNPEPQGGSPAQTFRRHGFLCLKGVQAAIGRTLTRDTTGIQTLRGGNFNPVGMILLCTNDEPIHSTDDVPVVSPPNDGSGTGARFSFGATDGVNQGAMWHGTTSQDAISASVRDRAMRTNRVLRAATDPATNALEASIDDFHRGGATININTSNSRQWELLYLLIGDPAFPEPAEITRRVGIATDVLRVPPEVVSY